MDQRIRRLFDDVSTNDEARELLENNPLRQDVLFRVENEDDVLVTIEAGSPEVTVSAETTEHELFATTVLELDQETLEGLLEGDRFSEHYLEGNLRVRGLPSIKILLGQLFRINHERRGRRR